MRSLCLAISAPFALAGCVVAPQSYRGINVGQERSAALAAIDLLWSTNSGTRCWPTFNDYAANTPDHSGGQRDRNRLAYYCFADEDRWLIWYRDDPNWPQVLTIVDVIVQHDRVSSIEVRRTVYLDL